MITDWTSHANFHPSANKIASKRMAVMSKPPKEVLDFVWAFQLPDFFPQPVWTVQTPTLLSTVIAISQ